MSLRVMIPIIPLCYMISDFLLDSKTELDRLNKLYKKASSSESRTEIKEQQGYIFNQGLQALRRHEYELPNCVRQYYLGNGPKPTMDQISQELKNMSGMHRKINRTISYAVVAFLVTVLFLLAILS